MRIAINGQLPKDTQDLKHRSFEPFDCDLFTLLLYASSNHPSDKTNQFLLSSNIDCLSIETHDCIIDLDAFEDELLREDDDDDFDDDDDGDSSETTDSLGTEQKSSEEISAYPWSVKSSHNTAKLTIPIQKLSSLSMAAGNERNVIICHIPLSLSVDSESLVKTTIIKDSKSKVVLNCGIYFPVRLD
jgi:hypothetical protein